MTTDSTDQPGADAPSEEPMDMATLLAESEDFRTPQRGEIVEGVIMGWDRDGALVDIGAKSEGVILRHEMASLGSNPEGQLHPDDKVMVYIVHPETSDGQIVLSLDKARGEQGWLTLQERFESGETFDAEVSGFNKGGLLVNVEGVNAFVPLSQVVGVRPDRSREDGDSGLSDVVGKSLRLKVIEINRRRNRVILSERAALQEWRMQQKERLIEELNEGDIRKGKVSSVRNFGVFVDLGGADGLAHLSELSWDRDKSPTELFKVGDEVDVYITKIDPENKKIALSLRRANPEKWESVVNKYEDGQVVTGLVTKLVTFGAFARIEGPVEGLIHVSELVDRRIGHPRDVVREGDLLPLKIVRIERDRHRLGLSLRRAREEGEQMGYVFSEGGEVIKVPEAIREEFEAREGPIPIPSDDVDDRLDRVVEEDVDEGDGSVGEESVAPVAKVEAPEAPVAEPASEPEPAPPREPQPAPPSTMEEALNAAGITKSEATDEPETSSAADASESSTTAGSPTTESPTAEAPAEPEAADEAPSDTLDADEPGADAEAELPHEQQGDSSAADSAGAGHVEAEGQDGAEAPVSGTSDRAAEATVEEPQVS